MCLAERVDIAQFLLTDGVGGLGLRARLVLFLSKLNGGRAPKPHRRVTRSGVSEWWSGLHLRKAGLCFDDPMDLFFFLNATDGSHGISLS